MKTKSGKEEKIININYNKKYHKIYLASDHAGFEMKEELKKYLYTIFKKEKIIDCGAYKYNPEDDYTDFVHEAAHKLQNDVEKNYSSTAFVFGGSGEGEAMVMNRYNGVRCTTYYGQNKNYIKSIIELGRQHNDANSISFGARFLNINEIKEAVNVFINTEFEGGRHKKRVENIDHKKGFLSRFF